MHHSTSDKIEWRCVTSFRRVFIALNETQSEEFLQRVVKQFMRLAAAKNRLGPGSLKYERAVAKHYSVPGLYYAVHTTVTKLERECGEGEGERLWLEVVKKFHPEAPSGFHDIGRMANRTDTPPPTPSPRVEPYPVHFTGGIGDE